MRNLLVLFSIKVIQSWWSTLLLFLAAAASIQSYIFSPHDIRGQSDFRPFNIAAIGGEERPEIFYCNFDKGPSRAVKLYELQCGPGAPEKKMITRLRMPAPPGLVLFGKDDPDDRFSFKRVSGDWDPQLIETDTYYNSDSLVTRYQVNKNFIEPISQVFITRGLSQMYVIIYLPMAFVIARILIALMRLFIRKCMPGKDGVQVGEASD
jgi:hypothetical protein